MFNLLDIKDPSFIKDLSISELKELAKEIRTFLIENLSKTGGHLSSNLGVVELTIALYYVFDTDVTDLLFDVGHQSYVHKILTGRAKDFPSLRKYGGLSGYICRDESKYDVWESGHSSTSISALSGLMLKNDGRRQIAIVGDSSMMNGVALEGLNFLGQIKDKNPIIILNDNKMGISKSVGALSNVFSKLRGAGFYNHLKVFCNKIFPRHFNNFCHQLKRGLKGLIQRDNIFEDMGFDYYGPYDGNNLPALISILKRIKERNEPVVLHVLTKKGKGYLPSEEDTEGDFHGVCPFDIKTGKPLNCDKEMISYSKVVANYLVEKRKKEDFIVITPAMKSGAKLQEFAELYPHDFYDVGIAEEHAAVMSAGLALAKKNVVLLMYSTFAQRAYDEILNDIARSNLKVIIGIDRAGIVGEDGATHQGVYDISMFMAMPNIVITMPKDEEETYELFNYAFTQNHPIVIRYPRGSVKNNPDMDYLRVCNFEWTILNNGNKGIVISYGPDVLRISNLVKDNNLDVMVVNARFIKPMDTNMLKKLFNLNIPILVVEQIIRSGTLYHKILEFKEENNYSSRIYTHSFDCNTIIPFGHINEVYAHYDFSDNDLLEDIKNRFKL